MSYLNDNNFRTDVINSLPDVSKQKRRSSAWRAAMNHSGYSLYVLECNGFYKIGITVHSSVASRVAGLQIGNPFKIKVVKILKSPVDLTKTERYIHKAFKKFRIRGEWFKLTPLDLSLLERLLVNYGKKA